MIYRSSFKRFAIILILILSFVLICYSSAFAASDWRVGERRVKDGFTFVMLENSTLGLCEVEYKGNGKSYKVPWEVDDHVVSTIMENSFNFIMDMDEYYRKTKKIPFVNEIVIPEPVTVIEPCAFRCGVINKLALPITLEKITAASLSGSAIKKITITEGHPTLKIENDCLINNNELLYVCNSKKATLQIPDNITDMSGLAANDYAVKLILPNSLITVGNGEMINYEFPSLKTIVIPKDLEKLPDLFIRGLMEIDSPIYFDTNEKVWGMPKLEKFEVEKGNQTYTVENGMLIDTSTGTVIRCPINAKVKDVVIPDTVSVIGDCAFFGCKNIRSVKIPDSVVTIGKNAFADCKNLKVVEMTDSVTSIGKGAFGSSTANNSKGYVPEFKIKVTEDSTAHQYFEHEEKQGNIKLKAVDLLLAADPKEKDQPDQDSSEQNKNVEATEEESNNVILNEDVRKEQYTCPLDVTSLLTSDDFATIGTGSISFTESGQYRLDIHLDNRINAISLITFFISNKDETIKDRTNLEGRSIRIDEITVNGKKINSGKNYCYFDDNILCTLIYANFDDVKVGKSWDGEEAKQQRIVDSDDFYMAQDVSIAFTYGCFTDKE